MRLILIFIALPLVTQALDIYGGRTDINCAGGVKAHFYIETIGSRKWLCTPLAHPYFFQGISNLSYNTTATNAFNNVGTPPHATNTGASYQDVLQTKYAGSPSWQDRWRNNTITRMGTWGFNGVSDTSSQYMWPWGAGGGDAAPTNPLPLMFAQNTSRQTFLNGNNFCATGPTKDLMEAVQGSAYTGFVGQGQPDVYDPRFACWIEGWATATQADSYYGLIFSSPYMVGLTIDESDQTYCMSSSGPGNPAPPDGIRGPHCGWIIAAVRPTMSSSARWGQTYSNTTVFSKAALVTFLTTRYGTIGALNIAWGSTYTTFGSAGGWPKHTTGGTGFLDEDGISSWLGTTDGMLTVATGANANTVTDLNDFLLAYSRQYFSPFRTSLNTHAPGLLLWTGGLDAHGGLTRTQTLQAAGEYMDVIAVGVETQDRLDANVAATGGAALFQYFVGNPANPDSSLMLYVNVIGTAKTDQPARGTEVASVVSALWNLTSGGLSYTIGYSFWDLVDLWSDNGSLINWGLVTAKDNAYDGIQACVATGTDAQGYSTGGELAVPTWQATHPFVSNGGNSGLPRDIIQATVSGTTYLFATTTSGTSGGSTPNWASATTVGQTVSDGSVTWTNTGVKTIAGCFGNMLTSIISVNQLWLGAGPVPGPVVGGKITVSGKVTVP